MLLKSIALLATVHAGFGNPPIESRQDAQLLREHVLSLYDRYMQSFQRSRGRIGNPYSLLRTIEGRTFVELSDCYGTYWDAYISSPDGRTPTDSDDDPLLSAAAESSILSTASYFGPLRETLRTGGYSLPRYQSVLDQAGREALLYYVNPYISGDAPYPDTPNFSRLSELLEGIRRLHDPGRPPFERYEDCGGPESPVRFVTQPPGADIWMITQFRFSYCEVQGLNPWRRDRCRYWVRVPPNEIVEVIGRFVYRATWRRVQTWGRGIINPLPDGGVRRYLIRR